MKNNYLTLYSSCVPVRGKERGAFYILDERKIEIVPLSLIDTVELLKKYPIEDCKKLVDSEEILKDYISFLISRRIGFITDEPQRFSEMPDCYDSPSFILLSCISVDENSSYNLQGFIQELDNLLCKHVELRILHTSLTIKQLSQILDFFEETTIRSIELHISNFNDSELDELKIILKKYKKVYYVVLFSMSVDKFEDGIIFTTKRYCDVALTTFNEKELYINIKQYFEAQKFNIFYNKKVSIDQNGYLKNNLICKTSFGKYCPNKNSISKVIKNNDFIKYWNVNPDKIEDIKDSELRYAIFPAYEIHEVNGKYYFKKD